MNEKNIFTILLENELNAENPNPAILKYGGMFLERLSIVGNQLENILLHSDLKLDNLSKIIVTTDEQIRLSRKGLAIMDIIKSEMPKIDDEVLADKYPLTI